MNDIQQDGPNDRVEQLFEELRQTPDAATADALEAMLVARLSHANSNGRKPDAMTTIALPHRDSRKSIPRFRQLARWAAIALVIPAITALLSIRPPDNLWLVASGTQDQTDQTTSDADIIGDGQPQVTLPNTETFNITSEITGREYQIFVSLPETYFDAANADTRYSVVYVLDGNILFGAMHNLNWLTDGVNELPPFIVVAIGYTEDFINQRVSDMASSPGPFLDFVGDELIALVDAQYRTESTPIQRTLMGHDVGGKFVMYVLVNRPELFGRYVATGVTTYEPEKLAGLSSVFGAEPTGEPTRLFLGAAAVGARDARRTYDALQEQSYSGLQVTFLELEHVRHAASAIPLWTHGLLYVYDRVP
ncbi:MAG: alpha/beta hydrolase [Chloroflexi bacterium]|nr:alpha/beta hydrolase [Chloroflexota bacterium]